MRILGKGKTAQAIKQIYQDAKLFDDEDIDIYDYDSLEPTIVSPGIPPHNHLVKHTKNKLSDYDLFLDDSHYAIWISGTNGKTTTTKMIQLLLQSKQFISGGNIGIPLANIYQNKNLILETSSFTLHYTNKAKPNIYLLLNVADDHISWHQSFHKYEEAKLKPLQYMDSDDIAILPYEYRYIKTKAQTIYFKNTLSLANQFNIDTTKLKFKEPFLFDSVASLVVASLVTTKLDYKLINSFIQDPHKMEHIKDSKNRIWINDSKATNIDATIWALKNFGSKKIYLILGGDDKDALLEILFEQLINYDIELFLIGKNMKKLSNLSNEYNIKSYECGALQQSVKLIDQKYKTQNQIAILSPAAASKDQFRSYAHRGDEFRKAVLNLL